MFNRFIFTRGRSIDPEQKITHELLSFSRDDDIFFENVDILAYNWLYSVPNWMNYIFDACYNHLSCRKNSNRTSKVTSCDSHITKCNLFAKNWLKGMKRWNLLFAVNPIDAPFKSITNLIVYPNPSLRRLFQSISCIMVWI